MTVHITSALLRRIASPYKSDKSKHATQETNFKYLPPVMNLWFPFYDIITPLRVAHFLAQSCVETADFTALSENAAHGGKEYDYGTKIGKKLGNTHLGDGPKYIGRGLLHLTGHDNYRKYGEKLNQDLEHNPERVAKEYDLAVRTACVFWRDKGLNRYADLDDFLEITHRVNGGHHGRVRREQALNKIKFALHI